MNFLVISVVCGLPFSWHQLRKSRGGPLIAKLKDLLWIVNAGGAKKKKKQKILPISL